MIPQEFANFFLASAGAGGALVGLLFVAISISPERTVSTKASPLRRATSASAFSALLNAFFISLAALIPRSNLGYITFVLGTSGVFNSLSQGGQLLRQLPHGKRTVIARGLILVLGVLIIYGFEIYYAFRALHTPKDSDNIVAIAVLILGVYGIGLLRAWELLGAQRQGIFAWLSPLHDEHEA